MTELTANRHSRNGFTLLEVIIVLFILGLLTAMAVPAVGVLDDRRREEITRERMDRVRRAILGPDDRFDALGRRVIGGYVGDMGAWPDLWEPRAEVKPSFGGIGWETPAAMATGLGQGPDYTINPAYVFFRPGGAFAGGRWHWRRPYRRLYDDPSHADHIGGPAVENEGQPRGLWTRYPEDLPFDLPGHPAPGLDLGDNWKGPYLAPPKDAHLSDSDHWATSAGAYDALEPVWHNSGAHANHETWEDGDDAPAGELGEHFDEKEAFRLLQTDGCLVDGWDRALRFFISTDPDHAGATIFWILSEGPDGEGAYPNKGSCTGHAWTVDAADTMAAAYDPDASPNRDNLVLKFCSRDWQAVFQEQREQKAEQTRALLAFIRQAVANGGSAGPNTGFSGDTGRLPRLFRWEDNGTPADPGDDIWDDADDSAAAYTKGQPRGLWTCRPNVSDPADDVPLSQWGLGWRHAYLAAPHGVAAEQRLVDAWGREILFFHDAAANALLILSRGADGRFAFGTVTADGTEPLVPTEALDSSGYDPGAADNVDNPYVLIAQSDWRPGFFRLDGFTVLDAFLNDPVQGTTKARFFGRDGAPVAEVDLLAASVLIDADGDGFADDWGVGGSPGSPAFTYDDTTAHKAMTGGRYLVFWNDADGNDAVDSGEDYSVLIYPVAAAAGTGQYTAVSIETGSFHPAP